MSWRFGKFSRTILLVFFVATMKRRGPAYVERVEKSGRRLAGSALSRQLQGTDYNSRGPWGHGVPGHTWCHGVPGVGMGPEEF